MMVMIQGKDSQCTLGQGNKVAMLPRNHSTSQLPDQLDPEEDGLPEAAEKSQAAKLNEFNKTIMQSILKGDWLKSSISSGPVHFQDSWSNRSSCSSHPI
ncbi:hypothetical protein WMY93_029429 [Mugilogobius chulae]|uniref:Uncharacterized protein n=1 Tax=Mugilogobius chulae TaxID=88201 RepID=A0AAW0MUI7_9GOBI